MDPKFNEIAPLMFPVLEQIQKLMDFKAPPS
jgi:hypothetical protein